MEGQSSLRQILALVRKNLLIIIVRKWFSTLLRSLVLPIALLVLLLEIQNFSKDNNKYGVGNTHSIQSLVDAMQGPKPLVIVQTPGLGDDVPPVIEKITNGLNDQNIIRLGDENEIEDKCPVDFHGNSPCYAVVILRDSPRSGRPNAQWNYTIQTDPSLGGSSYNVFDTNNAVDRVFLPLQSTIENAMANISSSPDILPYTLRTQEEVDKRSRLEFQMIALFILSFVFFLTMVPSVHHLVSTMSSERESGMSQLIDAMGGGVALSRVVSYAITFNILYLPLWIILGALFSSLFLPGQSAAIVIFWQVLTGWASTNASIFGTAFFKKGAFATIFVSLITILLAIFAAYMENLPISPLFFQVAILSLLFPSMNYVFFFSFITKAEIAGIPLKMQEPIPPNALSASISGQNIGINWNTQSGPYFLWVMLVAQIIVYPMLAILVENMLHGNNRRRRHFHATPEAASSHVAIETSDLTKKYTPSWFKRMCCCARSPPTKAVDGLNLISHKHQVLCLLGPNGSGKTTTLDMLSGFQTPTSGQININASASQIGICPQKNVMWDNLTVHEHLVIWNAIKGNVEDMAGLDQLIQKCDLAKKKNCFAGSLSGGMKRKLQLACMLVGGSSICLLDEVTSGLDPISRRAIWNVILSERSKRTIVFTTHFLDESEVLSDHIVIVKLGQMKCQGTQAELKNQYGGGYRVHIPKTENISGIRYPVTERRDRYICRTPDSTSAARLLALLNGSRNSEIYITGPTIEDVFLKVSEDPETPFGDELETFPTTTSELSKMEEPEANPTPRQIYSKQIRALILKKFILLRSLWWIYLFAMIIPIVSTIFLMPFLDGYVQPDCSNLLGFDSVAHHSSINNMGTLALGPESVNRTIATIVNETNTHTSSYGDGPYIQNSRSGLENLIHTNTTNLYGGGVWLGNDTTPLVAYSAESGSYSATALLNLANQVRSGVPVSLYLSNLKSLDSADGGNSMIYITIFCLLQAIYPAFFALYPTYERQSRVRALQYSNGIRPFSILFSYWVFDFIFVFVISICCTLLMFPVAPWFGVGYLFIVQVLYGLAAILFVYLVSMIASSQPSAFAFSILFMAFMYILSVITALVINITMGSNLGALDGSTFGLGLIFPIQNLFRAMTVSLNTWIVRCRGDFTVTDPGSIYAFGGPIFLLVLQNIGLFCLLLWLEGGSFAWISKAKPLPRDAEKTYLSGRPDVDAEAERVASSESDLLRVLHVSKNYGSMTAVDDVSFGLQGGEIFAVLGPNGAGKTTTINMIRGEMTPSSGEIYLEGVDVHRNTRLAQKRLGVCPQFDALDLLTVRNHLLFYSRCKGIRDVKTDVEYVMSKVGLKAHANTMAAKLSGGNKRKLSLAIALIGNPPVLLLDEPSSAMDAASKRVFWRTLKAISPGRSVLLTTHSMEEADALATRAAIVAKRMLAIGTTESLRKTHSNEYHVHLVLKSAPLSHPSEMQQVSDWVRWSFPNVSFEGENLGGQVRFIVPADNKVPIGAAVPSEAVSSISPVGMTPLMAGGYTQGGTGAGATQSFTRYLIETLEAQKENLGLDCYSISTATMESVFLRVVKESDADEDERVEKKPWWRW
ncbi:hypothetical protein F4810DRAFT_95308 [Camillea tinctor]|nr:hypothetical protein F4810DRAFT_95308 [Camillea tinctor]